MSFTVSISEETTACYSGIKGPISSGSSGMAASSGKDNFAKFRGLRVITHGQAYICRYSVFPTENFQHCWSNTSENRCIKEDKNIFTLPVSHLLQDSRSHCQERSHWPPISPMWESMIM